MRSFVSNAWQNIVGSVRRCPSKAEGLSASSLPATHAEQVVRSITAEAERLMSPALARPACDAPLVGASAVAGGVVTFTTASPSTCHAASALATPLAGSEHMASTEAGTYPRVVYDAFPTDGGSVHAGSTTDSLLFDSDFESANLRRAVQVGPREYHLVLSCDVNTRGHTQWFLFRVRGMMSDTCYRFHLINLMKPDSLFSSGMRPLAYSERQRPARIERIRIALQVGVG
jgi:hypothetical protein